MLAHFLEEKKIPEEDQEGRDYDGYRRRPDDGSERRAPRKLIVHKKQDS